MHEEKCAGAISNLRVSRPDASIAEERRLLIADSCTDRNGPAADCPRRALTQWTARAYRLRQHCLCNPELIAHSGVPGPRVQIQQQGSARVGVIGDKCGTAGEFIDQPGFDCDETNLTAFGPSAQTAFMIEQPFELRAGEVGIH